MIKRKGEGLGFSTKELLQKLADRDYDIFQYTKDAVLRDEFFAGMTMDITAFYKDPVAVKAACGVPGREWPRTTANDMRSMVRGIVKYKHSVACFNTEVHNFLVMHKLKNTHSPELESYDEKHSRKEGFWMHYHSRLRRNDLPPVCPNSPGRMGATSSGWRESLSPHPQKKAMCFAGEAQWDMIERIEEQSKPQRTRKPKVGLGQSMRGFGTSGGNKLGGSTEEKSLRASASEPALPTINNVKSSSRQASRSKSKDNGKGKGISLPPLARGNLISKNLQSRKEEVLQKGGATNSYLEACQRCWIVPTPLPFVTGHSWKLKAAGRDMLDGDLKAVAPMLQDVSSVEEIDLNGNVLLTEKALVPFLERLFGDPAASTLHSLNLSGLKHLGIQSMEVIGCLMSEHDGLRCLKNLDLSHVHITPKSHLKLAKAINQHRAIEAINFADTDLGSNKWIAKQCVSLLIGDSVRSLDVGWNCFDAEVFQHLGESLVVKRKIESLSIANCSSACIDTRVPSPVTFFLECLSLDTSITTLDVSLNRMDFRAMLIVEDALATHQKIQRLDISNNPLGILGMRSVLRLLCGTGNSLISFDSSGCYSASEGSVQTFAGFTNPGGRYKLELMRPYHRAILRMLYKICEKYKQPPDQAFLSLQYSKPGWAHTSKGSCGRFEVPKEGTLSFVFNVESTIENSIPSSSDFADFYDRYSVLTKIRPPFKKVIPLFACWRQLFGKSHDQLVFLKALSKDFHLEVAHIDHMVKSVPSMRSEIMFRLLPCVLGGEASESLCLMLFPSLGSFLRVHKRMRKFIDFNIENPTGHYKLDLENGSEHSLAEKLLLLDRWEVVLDRRRGSRDTSQRGNNSHVRNEQYRGKPLHLEVASIAEWTLPEFDDFEFDYITGKRCPMDAVILDENTFSAILVNLFDAQCTNQAKLESLRLVSHHMFMTARQMRELLGAFKSEQHRSEVFVTFFTRVRDMWNSKVFRVRFENEAELKNLQDRLGYATFFPFIQPENANFVLDYRFYDQRCCSNILMQLAVKEGMNNLRSPTFTYPDGSVDVFPMGVPRSWEDFKKMPAAGVFKAQYCCAPEGRKYATRQMLAETYGGFPCKISEEDVMWWTGLTEVSEDVLDWLEFCIGNFKRMDDAFIAIDGPDGNGVITLREFEEGVHELGCKKFKGKDEKKRIADLFRYLDPGGEGSVSRDEWAVLDQLWQEFNLCIIEFVTFLQRQFGNDLDDSWAYLDDDGSGELTCEEWMQAVENIGFFGPSKVVFSLLDNSDDGSISIDEFKVLDQYKTKHD
jgi:Ca2+-binding EF-hand superfamily protein